MSEVYARVVAELDQGPCTYSSNQLRDFETHWGVKCPEELVRHWERFGTVSGFAADNDGAEYLVLNSCEEALKHFSMIEGMPAGMAPIGNNGASEMIVFAQGKGYGLLQYVNGGAEDFQFVAETLEDFLAKSEQGKWFA